MACVDAALVALTDFIKTTKQMKRFTMKPIKTTKQMWRFDMKQKKSTAWM